MDEKSVTVVCLSVCLFVLSHELDDSISFYQFNSVVDCLGICMYRVLLKMSSEVKFIPHITRHAIQLEILENKKMNSLFFD